MSSLPTKMIAERLRREGTKNLQTPPQAVQAQQALTTYRPGPRMRQATGLSWPKATSRIKDQPGTTRTCFSTARVASSISRLILKKNNSFVASAGLSSTRQSQAVLSWRPENANVVRGPSFQRLKVAHLTKKSLQCIAFCAFIHR